MIFFRLQLGNLLLLSGNAKDLFEEKHASFKNEVNQSEKVRAKVADPDKLRNNLEAYDTGETTLSTSDRRPESLQLESKPEMTDLEKEILENISDMDKLKSLNKRLIGSKS
ncbi:hypothetical protein OIU76_012582 [Salix suchowensis]|uniref:Uncharacterized protein n=1 Tax=Salix koriyanagi TaxID=2511006 RepID=A0A9Q0WT54_9ROSI|nr:hypothetical protein OIU76_012582 [Salix suchowensis]KAJ6773060.1 hypothetical protein OIU74_019134 [Salix koriyanagi]